MSRRNLSVANVFYYDSSKKQTLIQTLPLSEAFLLMEQENVRVKEIEACCKKRAFTQALYRFNALSSTKIRATDYVISFK